MIISSNWMALKANGLSAKKTIVKQATQVATKQGQKSRKADAMKYVALDCEMVEGTSVEHMLARVSMVDHEGRVLYDAFVTPREEVRDYRTSITGLTKEILRRKGEPFEVVQKRVQEILDGKVIIGHAIHHDFEALEIPRPEDARIRDTCLFPALKPPNRKQTPSLRLLCEYWLDKKVQDGAHSSVEDARVTMSLFKKFRTEWDALFH
jgi:RNA exonuclease 4